MPGVYWVIFPPAHTMYLWISNIFLPPKAWDEEAALRLTFACSRCDDTWSHIFRHLETPSHCAHQSSAEEDIHTSMMRGVAKATKMYKEDVFVTHAATLLQCGGFTGRVCLCMCECCSCVRIDPCHVHYLIFLGNSITLQRYVRIFFFVNKYPWPTNPSV